MEIHHGTSRLVLVFPAASLVIKLPKFRLGKLVWLAQYMFYLCINRKFTKMHAGNNLRILHKMMTEGLTSNWSEFIFYWKTRDPFLEPSYISIFGLLNFAHAGTDCKLDELDFWDQMYGIIGKEAFNDGHHFSNPGNFSCETGKIRIRDYGKKTTQILVVKYGNAIRNKFNPEHRRTKRNFNETDNE